MTIKLGMLLLGSLLIYAGWKSLDVRSLLFGDNTTPKGSSSWTPSSGGNAASSGTGSAGGQSSSSPTGSPAANSAQVKKQTTGAEPQTPFYQSGGFFIPSPNPSNLIPS